MGNLIELIGSRFNKLTALRIVGKSPHGGNLWLCLCDCGKERTVLASQLMAGIVKSCGCSKRFGRMAKRLKPIQKPKLLDIAFMAGFYEGEGHCRRNATASECIMVGQKNPDIFYSLRDLFGGSIRKEKIRNFFIWHLCGTRARGLLMTIYKFLSPYRQEQIKKVLKWHKS